MAHGLDAVFVYILACCCVPKRLEEGLELPADEVNDLLLLDPLGERSFRVCVVIQSAKVWIVAMFSVPATLIPFILHHAQLLLTDHSSFFVTLVRLFIIHEGSSLSSPACSLHTFHLVELPLSLASLLDVCFVNWSVVDALLLVLIQLWHCSVITEKRAELSLLNDTYSSSRSAKSSASSGSTSLPCSSKPASSSASNVWVLSPYVLACLVSPWKPSRSPSDPFLNYSIKLVSVRRNFSLVFL